GQRGLDGNLGGFEIAHFADEDDVRVLPQKASQGAGKGHALLGVNLALDQSVDVVLDRVFGGQDLGVDLVERVERRVERGGFSRAGRAGDDHDTVGLVDELQVLFEIVLAEAELFDVERDGRAVKNTHDDALAEHGREHGHAKIDRVAAHHQADTAVLRQT